MAEGNAFGPHVFPRFALSPAKEVVITVICPFCGQETGEPGGHVTQRECREALCRRLEALRRQLEGAHEVKLSGVATDDSLDALWREMESVSQRINDLQKIDGALKHARLLGTRSAWEHLLQTLEAWRNRTWEEESSGS